MTALATLEGGPVELQSGELGQRYTILAPSFAKWFGSDGRALAQALRRLGHSVLDVDEEDFVPWRWQGTAAKILRRVCSRFWIEDYNEAVLQRAASAAYDFVLVFKGSLLKPETLRRLRDAGRPLFCFYPDLSFQDHGANIPASLQFYDCVFTTKTFHGQREIDRYQIRRLEHVRHGFDPEVHRPLTVSPEILERYSSDVSFVGCWSPKKEAQILHLLRHCEKTNIKVFGLGWKYASREFRDRLGANLRSGVFGDELSIVYCGSKINLGLLSCGVSDSETCDQTTARTFQIPATKALLLHEDTQEVRKLFRDSEEVMLFRTNDELVDQVQTALRDPELRKRLSIAGYERALSVPYDYSSAATSILQYFEARARNQ
jgi:spore maturation protein CgeB